MSGKIVIAGAGVSGLMCSVYLSRAGYETHVYSDEEHSMSCIAEAAVVENFPGFPDGISGVELIMKMTEQAEKSGVFIHSEGIVSVDTDRRVFSDSSDGVFSYDEFVMATGVRPRVYSCSGSDDIVIHTCALCDGSFYEGKTVAVIGGGDSAFGAADYLSGICSKVYMVIRRNVPRISNTVVFDKVKSKACILWESEITSFISNDGRLTAMVVNGDREYEIDGVFCCIGHDVNSVDITGSGRIFKCGDCVEGSVRQAVIAAGDGARTAIEIMSL